MEYVLLILATVTASLKAVLGKKIGVSNSSAKGVFFLNANVFLIAAITILICFSNKIKLFLEISSFSLFLALFFAAFLLFTQIMQILSMSRGFSSLTSLIYACGFLIPIFYSAAFLNEPISVYQLIGIALLIASLTVILPPQKDGKFSFVWLTFALLAMLGSGANAIIQKVHQSSEFKNELAPFIFYSLLFAAVFSLILSFAVRGKEAIPLRELYLNKKTFLLIIFDGIVIGVLNFANLKLAGQLPAVIHFPVYNVCSMIMTAVAGRVLFQERISARKIIGFGLGLVAITVIALL